MQLAGWSSAPKLLGIKVSDRHLVPVISRTRVSPRGRVAVVTGGAGAIGTAITKALQEA